MSNVETPRKIGKYVQAFEAALHNDRAFLQEFEKVAEQLDQMGQANFNLKEQLKKAIKHNKVLQDTVNKVNRERKEATKAFTSREDDTQMVLVANEQKIQEDKVQITDLANKVKKLQNKILADEKTQAIQADEIATKDTELGQADADASAKDATYEQKMTRLKQEKQAAIQAKLEFQRQMTEQSEEIISLREKITTLQMSLDKTTIDLVKAKRGNPNELHKVNIKY